MKGSTVTAEKDPVVISPHIYKVILETDQVRVLDITIEPGATSPEHSHPPYVIYVLNDATVKFIHADGRSETLDLKMGQAVWSDEDTHTVENLGATQARVLNIELKEQEEE